MVGGAHGAHQTSYPIDSSRPLKHSAASPLDGLPVAATKLSAVPRSPNSLAKGIMLVPGAWAAALCHDDVAPNPLGWLAPSDEGLSGSDRYPPDDRSQDALALAITMPLRQQYRCDSNAALLLTIFD